ncbi:Ribosome biogenesis GTPase A [bioreactor metagenome]|uniref:Ribosome biogenesis GTPase A n=1 Tax=bioreactor metagenome TaxID=1076179 RepID=A0A645HAF7_9ZZZZ
MKAKGVNKVVRCMIVGIPNVGKSTLINRMAGESRAEVGDRPGVTRGKQWVRISPYLELMDTPGMLWPKLEDQELAKHLAFLGSIKDEIMDSEELATDLLMLLQQMVPAPLTERFSKLAADTPREELLNAICRSRGFLLRGGELDTERASHVALDEFRAGKIARVTLEQPEART